MKRGRVLQCTRLALRLVLSLSLSLSLSLYVCVCVCVCVCVSRVLCIRSDVNAVSDSDVGNQQMLITISTNFHNFVAVPFISTRR